MVKDKHNTYIGKINRLKLKQGIGMKAKQKISKKVARQKSVMFKYLSKKHLNGRFFGKMVHKEVNGLHNSGFIAC